MFEIISIHWNPFSFTCQTCATNTRPEINHYQCTRGYFQIMQKSCEGEDTPHTCNFSFADSTCLQPNSGNTNLCDPLAFPTYSPNLFLVKLHDSVRTLSFALGTGCWGSAPPHLPIQQSVGAGQGAGQGPALHRP